MSVREISAGDLALLLERGSVVIDVREPDEYREGHIPGAISVPLGTVPESIDLFRSAAFVYIVCQTGGRSMRACEYLHDAGVTNVLNVAGGTMGFAALGNSLVVGDQA